MIRKLSEMILNEPKDDIFIDKEILDTVVYIAKKNIGNILFLFSIHSYNNEPHFQNSRVALSNYIHANMKDITFKQRLNGQDLRSADAFESIVLDLQNTNTNTNPEKDDKYERLIFSVFTTSRAELDEIAIKCLSLEGVSVYII